jgi:adenylate kinase family enzyme
MRRVLVIGSGGSGKTTLARRLGQSAGLPVVHLDARYWRPGWVAPSPEEWEATVRQLLAADAWIMDGNYGGTLDLRLGACDTVVFLDLSRTLCLWRVLKRQVRWWGRSRPELPAGCPERFSWEFLRWIWTYPARRRPGILERLARIQPAATVIHLRSDREIERFLARVALRGSATPE